MPLCHRHHRQLEARKLSASRTRRN
jgi:hypothetical protein